MKKITIKRYAGFAAALFLSAAVFLSANAAFDDVEAAKLIPVGRTTGIKLKSDGVVITGFSDRSPIKNAGAKTGDIIVTVNGMTVTDGASLQNAILAAKDRNISVEVKRGDKTVALKVQSAVDENGKSILGAFMRDTLAGIGTITFLDPEDGSYGALGHGIAAPETSELSDFSAGSLMPSAVTGIKKGQEGTPGELIGVFELSQDQGTIVRNTESGIFGKLRDPEAFSQNEIFETTPLSQVHPGKAYILSNISGTDTKKYEIEVLQVYDESNVRQMLIQVTDGELLEKTGGIVQGMSGSPIIQNDRLIGAVTHVLINDPQRGYAIGIESMLDQIEEKAAA